MSSEKGPPGCLEKLGIKYYAVNLGIIINHYKDPYSKTNNP